jgi:hypothetical protein
MLFLDASQPGIDRFIVRVFSLHFQPSGPPGYSALPAARPRFSEAGDSEWTRAEVTKDTDGYPGATRYPIDDTARMIGLHSCPVVALQETKYIYLAQSLPRLHRSPGAPRHTCGRARLSKARDAPAMICSGAASKYQLIPRARPCSKALQEADRGEAD